MNKKENVFVYGTLMKGYWNHVLLKDQKFIGRGIIKGYRMYHVSSFPGIVESGYDEDIIVGELYEINEAILEDLDRLEDEGYMYKRLVEDVIIKDKIVKAHVYVWLGRIGESERVEIEDMPWQPRRRKGYYET